MGPELLDLCDSVLHVLRNYQAVFYTSAPFHNSPVSPHACLHLFSSTFIIVSGYEVVFPCGSDLHFPGDLSCCDSSPVLVHS